MYVICIVSRSALAGSYIDCKHIHGEWQEDVRRYIVSRFGKERIVRNYYNPSVL